MERNDIYQQPYVSIGDIEAEIATEHYFTAADGVKGAAEREGEETELHPELVLTTFCVLVLHSGLVVTGEFTNTRVYALEYRDDDHGRKVARKRAFEKLSSLVIHDWKKHRNVK